MKCAFDGTSSDEDEDDESMKDTRLVVDGVPEREKEDVNTSVDVSPSSIPSLIDIALIHSL